MIIVVRIDKTRQRPTHLWTTHLAKAALSGWPLGHGALLILDHNAGSAVARVKVFYLYSEKMETAMRFQEGNVVR